MPPGATVGSTSIPTSHYADVAEHLLSLSPHETGAVSTTGVGYSPSKRRSGGTSAGKRCFMNTRGMLHVRISSLYTSAFFLPPTSLYEQEDSLEKAPEKLLVLVFKFQSPSYRRYLEGGGKEALSRVMIRIYTSSTSADCDRVLTQFHRKYLPPSLSCFQLCSN